MTTSVVVEDDWSIVNDQIESMTIDDIYPHENDHEWEFCEYHDDNGMVISSSSSTTIDGMENQSSSSIDYVSIPIVGGYIRVSYKDVLLKQRKVDESLVATVSDGQAIAPRQPWRPRIEVNNTPWKRVDREYGPSSSSQFCGDEYDGTKTA